MGGRDGERERVKVRERKRERERILILLLISTDKGAMSEGHSSLSSRSGMAADVWS